MAIDTAEKRFSMHAYSGGDAALCARLDGISGINAADRLHLLSRYRGIAVSVDVEVHIVGDATVDLDAFIQKSTSSTVQGVANIIVSTNHYKYANCMTVGDALLSISFVSAQGLQMFTFEAFHSQVVELDAYKQPVEFEVIL